MDLTLKTYNIWQWTIQSGPRRFIKLPWVRPAHDDVIKRGFYRKFPVENTFESQTKTDTHTPMQPVNGSRAVTYQSRLLSYIPFCTGHLSWPISTTPQTIHPVFFARTHSAVLLSSPSLFRNLQLVVHDGCQPRRCWLGPKRFTPAILLFQFIEDDSRNQLRPSEDEDCFNWSNESVVLEKWECKITPPPQATRSALRFTKLLFSA